MSAQYNNMNIKTEVAGAGAGMVPSTSTQVGQNANNVIVTKGARTELLIKLIKEEKDTNVLKKMKEAVGFGITQALKNELIDEIRLEEDDYILRDLKKRLNFLRKKRGYNDDGWY